MAAVVSKPLRIFATNQDHARLCTEAVKSLVASAKRKVKLEHGETWSTTPFPRGLGERAVVVSRLADFGSDDPVPRIGRLSQYLMFTERLPPEAIAARIPRLRVGDAQRLHLAREQTHRDQAALVKRLITGIALPGQRKILDAWWEHDDGGSLVVISPEYSRLRLPVAALKPFLGDQPRRLSAFSVDEDGDFLHWPHADVHFGWDELEALADPIKAAGAKTREHAFAVQYGRAIKQFREITRLSQSDISGMDARHVRRIEHGEIRVSPRSIQLLAAAHRLEPDRYLAEIADLLAR